MKIQWLGHSAFKLTGKNACVLIDPFLTGNPSFSGSLDEAAEGVTHILLTHAHNDHFGDTLALIEKTGAQFISIFELADYVAAKSGSHNCVGMGIGGRFKAKGFAVTMVQAFHSSSYKDPDGSVIYGGMPTGLIVEMDGERVYHMGDTGLFGDMALIAELAKPTVGIVPIGGHFTMDADAAALAVNRYFDFHTVIPCHYGTFPVLAESAQPFAQKVEKGTVRAPEPMETIEI